MPITYTVVIDLNSNDDTVDTGENISADVLELAWRLGLKRPFDSVSVPMWARVTVRNPTRAYSPENALLRPGSPLRIRSDDGATSRTHFSGFISHIEPLAGEQGERTAIIHAYGPESWLEQSIVRLPPR